MSPLYLVCEGDSLTVGFDSGTNYPIYLAQLYTDNRMVSIQNWGLPGDTIANMLGEAATQIDPEYDARKGRNFLCVWAGTNDMGSGTSDVTTTYNNYVTYCAARRAAGFKVLSFTIINRADTHNALWDTGQPIFNSTIRANWQSYADALIDVQAQTNLQDPTNLTYFQSDKIHLTGAGYRIVAGLVKTAIDSLN